MFGACADYDTVWYCGKSTSVRRLTRMRCGAVIN